MIITGEEIKKGQTFTNGTTSTRHELLCEETLLTRNLTTGREYNISIDSHVYDVKDQIKKVTRKAQFATANNSKVGDKLKCLCIPYYVDDMRVYYEEVTIESIEISKTGKRVKVMYSDGRGVSNIGLNTYFQPITDKWIAEMIEERGFKK